MKKIKTLSLLLFISLFVENCGFKPIYSSNNLDLKFNEIDYKPTILNKQIVQTLNSLSNPDGAKNLNIKFNTTREKYNHKKFKRRNRNLRTKNYFKIRNI